MHSKFSGVGLAALLSISPAFAEDVPVFLSDKLHVDYGPGIALCKASREEGEKQLAELALTEKHEDAWIFREGNIPVWIDIGRQTIETKTSDGETEESVYIDLEEGGRFLKPGDDITLYHIHPGTRSDLKELEQTLLDIHLLYLTGKEDAKDYILEKALPVIQTNSRLLRYNFPSHLDYIVHCYAKKAAAKAGLKLRNSRVIGPDFMVDYDSSKNYTEKDAGTLSGKLMGIISKTIGDDPFEIFDKKIGDYERCLQKLGISVSAKRLDTETFINTLGLKDTR